MEHDNSKSEEKGSSKEEKGTTFENPESPTESSKSHYNITVCWMSSEDGSIQKYQLQYRFDGSPVSDVSDFYIYSIVSGCRGPAFLAKATNRSVFVRESLRSFFSVHP